MNVTNMSLNVSRSVPDGQEMDYTLASQLSISIAWLETLFIVALNLVIIGIILREGKKKSRMYFFLLHLALADLCVGLLDVFPNAVERSVGLAHGTTDAFLLPSGVCKVVRMVAKTTLLGSNFILTAMSIDRALAVGKPLLRYGKGPLIQKSTIAISWCLALCFAVPDAVLNDLDFYSNESYQVQHCSIRFDGTNEEITLKWRVRFWTDFLFIFLLPAGIIVITYTYLLIVIFRRGILPGSERGCSRKDVSYSNPSQVFDRRLPVTKIRSVKLTLGIVLGFIICWTPYFLWNLLQLYGLVRDHPAITVCMTLRYLNSVANPIMFFVFHRKRNTDPQQSSPLTSVLEHHVTSSFLRPLRNRFSVKKTTDVV